MVRALEKHMYPMIYRFVFALSPLLLPAIANGQEPVVAEIQAKVIGVHDGDTIKVLVDKVQTTVRLEAIDAPEIGQGFGTKSKTALATLVMGKTVLVKKTGVDKYGRTLAFVEVNGTQINAEMIKVGFAWHFKKYSDDKKLAELELDAKEREVGLWADSDALPPWEYRERKKIPADELHPPKEEATTKSTTALTHWLNTASSVRHNASCEHYKNTKKGRACSASEGKACGKCGG
jgi:micrococcal nuclease